MAQKRLPWFGKGFQGFMTARVQLLNERSPAPHASLQEGCYSSWTVSVRPAKKVCSPQSGAKLALSLGGARLNISTGWLEKVFSESKQAVKKKKHQLSWRQEALSAGKQAGDRQD